MAKPDSTYALFFIIYCFAAVTAVAIVLGVVFLAVKLFWLIC